MTRLRISAHDLKIETGRYSNQVREERTCSWCKLVLGINVIENEQHFLFECDLYNIPRREFLLCITANGNDTLSGGSSINGLIASTGLHINPLMAIENNTVHNSLLSKTIANMFKICEKIIESIEN